jgi:hypothetical protein
VLRRIFGSKRDEKVGGCKRWHNEELHILCSSRNIIRMIKSRRIKRAGHVARMRIRGMHAVLVGKREGKRPLGRPRRRWENITMDLREIGWGCMVWIFLSLRQRPVEGSYEHNNEPSSSIKFS